MMFLLSGGHNGAASHGQRGSGGLTRSQEEEERRKQLVVGRGSVTPRQESGNETSAVHKVTKAKCIKCPKCRSVIAASQDTVTCGHQGSNGHGARDAEA
ncbi:hypothetical protein E2C01_066241 [Portunus trituberculatus]|uniref:Uncharacterized protein n=1 Tax=Portunus trituberculatus TaxID=210409 RepID=A0A5B7HQE3_PORTR|nr:hypothetical protein [Portunus trituberculatus]